MGLRPRFVKEGDMEQEHLYIIAIGSEEDWRAGHRSAYCIEDGGGERALPVFTTLEGAERYINENFSNLDAYMQTFESAVKQRTVPLVAKRFTAMQLDTPRVAEIAVAVEADYLLRDPQPGPEQEVLRSEK